MRFDVIDQGVGIPADDLPKVRQRFVVGERQEDRATDWAWQSSIALPPITDAGRA